MLIMLRKTILLTCNEKISFCFFKNKKFLLASRKSNIHYFEIPNYIFCEKESNTLILNSELDSNLANFENFCSTLTSFLKNLNTLFRKKLILKGLGFRVLILENLKVLEFKIGLSHVKTLEIPKKGIQVIVNKSNIIIEGFDRAEVGNFANKIRSLRLPDIYKGKGFWYFNENIVLKEIKKK